MTREELPKPKLVVWMGSSRIDLKTFPEDVQAHIGYALYAAQCGEEYATVKALKGFGSRSVLEIVASYKSTRTEPFTQFGPRMRFTCFTRFRRSQRRASRRQSPIWI
jgi:phage-related protein